MNKRELYKEGVRIKTIVEGAKFVNTLSMKIDLNEFGDDMIQFFYDLSLSSKRDNERFIYYAKIAADKWYKNIGVKGWYCEKEPNTEDILHIIAGIYCMDKIKLFSRIRNDINEAFTKYFFI